MSILESFSLKGQLALVTGSSSGIGLGLAAALMQAGADVVINGRNVKKLAEAAKVLSTSSSSKVYVSAFDVTNSNDVLGAVTDIEKTMGPLDILINNAGMQIRNPLHEFAVSDWQTLMRTNLDSMFFVGQAVANHMIKRGKGKIINVCSVQSELGRPGIAPYMASKGAVKMLTKGMAIDWGPHGLQVNGLGPGYFKTELNEKLVADEKFSAWLINRTPTRRWGEVEELVGAAVFLASNASSFMNGHILYVDGGVTATL